MSVAEQLAWPTILSLGIGKWEAGSEEWEVGSGKWRVGSGKWEVGSEEWEVGSGKWEVGSVKWEVEDVLGSQYKSVNLGEKRGGRPLMQSQNSRDVAGQQGMSVSAPMSATL